MPSQVIQWFPGHMAKTRRMITENIKNVDAIIEMRDSRIPLSSKNPEIERLTQEVEYLKIATTIVPDRTQVENSRAILTKLVREIDKCILELKE